MSLRLSTFLLVCSLVYTEDNVCESGHFGTGCRDKCHCLNEQVCNVKDGHCSNGCAENWSGSTCQKNTKVFESKEDFGLEVDNVINNPEQTRHTICHMTDAVTLDLQQHLFITTITFTAVAANASHAFGWGIKLDKGQEMEYRNVCTSASLHSGEISITCNAQLSTRYIKIINDPGPVQICRVSVTSCSDYWFGSNCESECACNYHEERCEVTSGTCTSGCRAGRMGNTCQTDCKMSYGPDCLFKCGHCANKTCEAETGFCPDGCDPGWEGLNCTNRCQQGTHGRQCNEICGHCFNGETCNFVTGQCANGCQAGWSGSLCKSGCAFSKYGMNCAFDCGHCDMMSHCNKSTGICETGCRPGWTGLFCTRVCPVGLHGPGCTSECGHCIDKDCNKETGFCTEQGCFDGWKGERCDLECWPGTYGKNCNNSCGHCRDEDICSTVAGECPNDCSIGYYGISCTEECMDGFYGENCSSKCGVCAEKEPCDKITGICERGCFESYVGDRCDEEEEFIDLTQPIYKIIVGVSISTCGVVLTCVVVCLVINWRREDLTQYDTETAAENMRLEQSEELK